MTGVRSPLVAATPAATSHVVRVPVTTVWTAPDSPRPVDAAIVAEEPDAAAWLAALDADAGDDEAGDGRLGLHGRVETQLLAGEPVVVSGTDAAGAWSHVVAPWQLSPKDERGYPGWVPTAHLVAAEVAPSVGGPQAKIDVASSSGDHPAVDEARRHIGLPYL